MPACPTELRIMEYLEAALAPNEERRIREHVRHCSACLDLVCHWRALAKRSGATSRGPCSGDRPSHGPTPVARRFFAGLARDLSDLETEVPPLQGKRIGRYAILEHIGSGGMAHVFAAYDTIMDRKVAFKVVRETRRGATSDVIYRQRLLREARAVAKLSHANVVSVYDAGVAGDHLFIAMEYVEGRTLADWVKSARPPWHRILNVYLQAARGLAAAHEMGLVHRDFKPSNAMIDRDGQARVLDFGLATLTNVRTGGGPNDDESESVHPPNGGSRRSCFQGWRAKLTRSGALLGTPAYMAPEQFHERPVTARSDQFSFCVALFEAMYGQRPYQGADLPELVSHLDAGRLRGPVPRKGGPRRIRRILLKGLSLAPSERYSSMAELAQTLSRASATHRVRRRIGGSLVAIAGFLALGMWLGQRELRVCTHAPAAVRGIWDQAAKDRVRRAFVASGRPYAADTFARVDEHLDEWVNKWQEHHARACAATRVWGSQSEDALDLRMACLDQKRGGLRSLVAAFAEKPDGELLDNAVEAVVGLGDLEACADVQALQQQTPPFDDPRARRAVQAIRLRFEEVRQSNKIGRYGQAAALLDRLRPEVRELDYPPLRGELALLAGLTHDHLGHYAQAESELERALLWSMQWKQWDSALEAAQVLALVVGDRLERHAEGLAFARTALGLSRSFGKAQEASSLDRVGVMLARQGRHAEAEVELRRALATLDAVLGSAHPLVARSRNNLAAVLILQRRYDEAEVEFRRALASREEVYGTEHPAVAATRNNLAAVLHFQSKLAEAESEHRRALAAKLRAFGAAHPSVAKTRNNLGTALYQQGRLTEAESEHRRALATKRAVLGPYHPSVAVSRRNLGAVLRHQGRYEESETELRRAIAINNDALGPQHPSSADTIQLLGQVLFSRGRYGAAETEVRRALALLERAFDPAHPQLAPSLALLGQLLLATGRHEQAAQQFDRALTICRSHACEDRAEATAAFGMAKLVWRQGRENRYAIALARQAQQRFARFPYLARNLASVETWLEAREALQRPAEPSRAK